MSHYLFKKFIARTKRVDLVSSSSTLENRKWSSLPAAVQQWPAELKTKLLLRYSDNMCWPGGEALCFNPIIILCRINDWILFLPSSYMLHPSWRIHFSFKSFGDQRRLFWEEYLASALHTYRKFRTNPCRMININFIFATFFKDILHKQMQVNASQYTLCRF